MMLNPILERELRSKMRSWKTPIAIIVYLFFIGMITYTGLSIFSFGHHSGFDPRAAVEIFDFVCIFQMGLIMFIVPLITGASISGERQRQTLDLMLCTDISSMKIILGKIFSGLSTVLLLVVMATPFLGISFILGGVSFWDVIKIIIYYILSAFYISTIALFSSTQFKKNVSSIIMSYVFMGILYIVPFMFFMAMSVNYDSSFYQIMDRDSYLITSILFGPNPVFGILSLTSSASDMTRFLSSDTLPFLNDIPTWVISIVWFVLISTIMMFLAKRNLEKKE